MNASAVGKTCVEVKRALHSLVKEWGMGHVSSNRKDSLHTTYDWIIREKNDLKQILQFIQPFTRLKKKQVTIEQKILQRKILTRQDLIISAQLADSLSSFNV